MDVAQSLRAVSPTVLSEETMRRSQPVAFVDLVAQHQEIADEVAAGFADVCGRAGFTLGSEVAEFEAEFARWSGVASCVGVGSGTDAIELALRAAGIGPGDDVLLPANTFVATAEAIVHAGARPVIVDSDPEYHLVDPVDLEARITERSKAVVPVHLFGQLAPMEGITRVAATHGLVVIEDAAQAQGATRHGVGCGSWGAAAATSFYPGKNLGAYGDAGAVLTNTPAIAEAVSRLRDHGSAEKYRHEEIGRTSRLDTLQAVVLLAKLQRLAAWNQRRRDAAARYDALLGGLDGVRTPRTLDGNEHVWHLYTVRVSAARRDGILGWLRQNGIGAGIHYPVPIHLQPAFVHLGHGKGAFPNAEAAADELLSLPMHPHLSATDQERTVEVLAEALAEEGVAA